MLEHPSLRGAKNYVIQITDDTSDKSFVYPLLELHESFPASIVSHLSFGKNYIWRFAGIVKGKSSGWNGPYAFRILPDPFLINKDKRLHVVLNDSSANAGGLIVADWLHCIFDRKGNLVWFFPGWNTHSKRVIGTDNLCLTASGTITALSAQNATEYDLNGKKLWVAPFNKRKDAISGFGDFYNHDFKRLPNGHYMVIAINAAWKKLPPHYATQIRLLAANNRHRKILPSIHGARAMRLPTNYIVRMDSTRNEILINMGGLFEYDKKDSLVWSWEGNNYIKDEDIFPDSGKLNPYATFYEPHLNGFSVDAKNKYVYASFRTISRIVKIEKETGKVVNSWGAKMPSGEARDGENFFRKQHGPLIMDDGNIAVFDDADTNIRNEPSSVRIFSQPSPGHPSKIIWEFDCAFDSVMKLNKSYRGGNVDLLPNGNYLVCMGQVNRIFEITKNKSVVWSALTERKARLDSGWLPYPLYRAHYTSSLYPCYFTIETKKDTLRKRNAHFKLEIYNAGTNSDSYTIALSPGTGGYDIKKNSGVVAAGHSVNITLHAPAKSAAGTQIEVLVKSDTNPDNERVACLLIN
jgi:hypothetical protein